MNATPLLRSLGLGLAILASTTLAGCNTLTRLSEIGDGPKLTKTENPMADKNYKPVSMPMPTPRMPETNPSSLWRTGAKGFFRDIRAKEIGDILTVSIDISDSAVLNNKTTRKRADTENADVTNLLGFEGEFSRYLPEALNPASVSSFGSAHDTEGTGLIDRDETIKVTLGAVVTQILPNGYFAIMGRQEVRVNDELREMMVTGVVRPEDIEADNTISDTKIAEMRVAYGGRGTLSDLQRPRWGTQIWDVIFPF